MFGIIYKYTNKINHKNYVGQTLYEEQRKKAHFSAPANCKFHKAIHYYGWMNFDYEVLERDVPQDKLSERELYWIKYYDCIDNGYNTKEKSCVQALESKIIQKENNYHNTRLPYGYKHIQGKIYINEEEAEIIKNIFNDYINNDYSFKSLKQKYSKYIKCPSAILKNNKYIGDDILPQIISKDIFERAQNIIKSSKHKSRLVNPVIIDGIKYKSLSAASKELNITNHYLYINKEDFLKKYNVQFLK